MGLLAAAQGRRREDPIADLLTLRLGVRIDQAGSLLRDYHTVSDYRGVPLPSAAVSAKGTQKRTQPAKHTHVTQRFYLQDAVFVVAVEGQAPLLRTLADAVRRPSFPLALGRRACVPAQPLLIPPWEADHEQPLWHGDVDATLATVTWMASNAAKRRWKIQARSAPPSTIDLAVTVDDDSGTEVRADVPMSFAPRDRGFVTRRVRHGWVSVPTGLDGTDGATGEPAHDPFALLGW
jgi:CRISPR system Cascade subunit CasD